MCTVSWLHLFIHNLYRYAKDKELATWAFGKHYSIILQNQEFEFLNSMRNLVRDIASSEEMSTTTVFMRRIRVRVSATFLQLFTDYYTRVMLTFNLLW